jgi:hypothetical protein
MVSPSTLSLAIATPKLSNAGKMPCKSWSLPAWNSCPAAKDKDGKPVPACNYCYALTGAYRFPATIASRAHNMEDWKKDGWIAAMVKAIGKAGFFRWFDSGDVYSPILASKILSVITATPNTKHWLPTRMWKVSEVHTILIQISELPNAVVRYSSDSIHGSRVVLGCNSTIIQGADDFTPEKGKALCRAYTRKGKCKDCRACWSKDIETVYYALHGNKVKDKWFV